MSSTTSLQAKDIEQKSARISQLEKDLDQLRDKNKILIQQQENAQKSFEERERQYKDEIAQLKV